HGSAGPRLVPGSQRRRCAVGGPGDGGLRRRPARRRRECQSGCRIDSRPALHLPARTTATGYRASQECGVIAGTPGLVTRHGTVDAPDPGRVITKLFVPGEETPETRSRAAALIGRVLALPDSAVAAVLAGVLAGFSDRHHDFTGTLERAASIMSHRIVAPDALSP